MSTRKQIVFSLHDANELKTQKFNTKRSRYGINFDEQKS